LKYFTFGKIFDKSYDLRIYDKYHIFAELLSN